LPIIRHSLLYLSSLLNIKGVALGGVLFFVTLASIPTGTSSNDFPFSMMSNLEMLENNTYSLWVPLGHIYRPLKATETSKESFELFYVNGVLEYKPVDWPIICHYLLYFSSILNSSIKKCI